jgi:hypothetical protein
MNIIGKLSQRSFLRSAARSVGRKGEKESLLRCSPFQRPGSHFVRSLSNAASAMGTHKVDYDFENLVEMQIKSCDLHKDEKFLGTFDSNQGSYNYINFAEFGEQINKFRGVLAVHNIGVDEKVCHEMILSSLSLVRWL